VPERRFYPGVIDYSGPMSAVYRSGRTLSTEAARIWTSIVAPFVHIHADTRILDLGSGTGRFSLLFSQAFGAQVVGVDPSVAMLAAAASDPRPKRLSYVAGSAEALPIRDRSCSLAWMSHVWHHVRDQQACTRELFRVVSDDGHALVRGTFGDQLDGFRTLFRFWPAAQVICEQLPTIQQTVAVFEGSGFVFTERRRVDQTTADSLREFAQRTRFRADTALALISDEAFRDGQAAIEMAASLEHPPNPVVEGIELLVFRKR
jgi:ubiquinone/menaquinone biosynthesis C-methylase UbiE